MTNFKITFSNPWLLLLLIPAFALTLFPYFRLAKKYRRNRNRIVSVVLHSLVMVLCITLLSGMMFLYDVPNKENELIILVDSSYSNQNQYVQKDEFIQDVIDECGKNYKVGIVKFGYDQVYAAEISENAREVYGKYLDSEEPDTTATDFASALNFASGLFTNKETAKILLISDGFETDGSALSVIRSVAAEGIKVDAAHFPDEEHKEVQVVDAVMPDYNIKQGTDFNISLTLANNVKEAEVVSVKVVDTDSEGRKTESDPVDFLITDKTQSLDIKHNIDIAGLHELRFELSVSDNRDLQENNVFYSYIYLNIFNKILIIENKEGESTALDDFLKEHDYDVTTVNTDTKREEVPSTLAELCGYEQVILVNIAYSDMPAGFEEILNSYVSSQGGGLFTVGGELDVDPATGESIPHAYNRDDMLNSTYYQQMLPVQVINYTPPTAVMLIIDHSGSMQEGPDSPLGVSKAGARDIVEALSPRDYCGVMTLDNRPDHILDITPLTQKQKILDAINNISTKGEGGTLFANAFETAGDSLSSVDVQKRHILLVTDGAAADMEANRKLIDDIVRKNALRGVTLSIIAYQPYAEDAAALTEVTALGGGSFYQASSATQISGFMFDDLQSQSVSDVNQGKEFIPRIRTYTSAVAGIETATFPKLTGYYGTREKEGSQVVLVGEYVPIFAQWKYGKGSVGSFMCDLNGKMSAGFLDDDVGQRFILNVVDGLFPVEDIKPKEINVVVKEDNYTTYLDIATPLNEGDTVELNIQPITDSADEYYSGLEGGVPYTVSEGYTRFSVVITQPGVYRMTLTRKNAAGQTISSVMLYKTFSYSQEYNLFPEKQPNGEELLQRIATDGNGMLVEDSLDVFDSFVKFLNREFDPRLLFLILAIVFFLLDVAVRKFKFKWPHEIIRDYRQKKEMNNKEHDK